MRVTFPSPNLASLDAAALARARALTVCAEFVLPQGARHGRAPGAGTARGAGRFPAVVVCQGLGGPTAEREHAYARRLAGRGYAALVLDSFASRRVAWLPDALRALAVAPAMVLSDAFAALAWLCAHPAVDPGAVSVLGFSYGGMAAALAAHEQVARAFDRATRGARFAAHASYYGCTAPRLEDTAATGAPVLMLAGELDRNLSLPRAEAIAADLRAGGTPAELRVLPGAYHAWDGGNARRKRVFFSLAGCELRLGRDGRVRDERTGRPVEGWPDYARLFARPPALSGYHMLRCPETTRATDAALFAFLRAAGQAPLAA